MNFMHVKALCYKEILQIKNDRSVFIIIFVMPVILIMIYGFGLMMDVKPVKVALFDADNSSLSIKIRQDIGGSDYFALKNVTSLQQGRDLLYKNEVIALIVLPEDLERNVYINKGSVLVNINGSESFNAFVSQNYITSAIDMSVSSYLKGRAHTLSHKIFAINYRHYFNQRDNSSDFLMPGQIVGIVTLIACFMCSIVIAREFDRDSFDGLKATAMSAFEFVLSKFIPYFILALTGACLTVVLSFFIFDLPYRGSYLMGGSVLVMYVFTSVSLGLFISILTKNQFLASVLSVIVSFLPSILLSGIIFDLRAIAPFIAKIAYALPPTYAVEAMRISFLSGGSMDIVLFDLMYISVCGAVFYALCVYLVRKSLNGRS